MISNLILSRTVLFGVSKSGEEYSSYWSSQAC